MAAQTKAQERVLNQLKVRIEQLEQQADALRSGLDEIAVLLEWTAEHSIPASALERIMIGDEQVVAARQWDSEQVPDELARLFLQAHTLATRLKQAVPPEEKQAIVSAVVETFRQVAESEHLQVPVEMEVTIGD